MDEFDFFDTEIVYDECEDIIGSDLSSFAKGLGLEQYEIEYLRLVRLKEMLRSHWS